MTRGQKSGGMNFLFFPNLSFFVLKIRKYYMHSDKIQQFLQECSFAMIGLNKNKYKYFKYNKLQQTSIFKMYQSHS